MGLLRIVPRGIIEEKVDLVWLKAKVLRRVNVRTRDLLQKRRRLRTNRDHDTMSPVAEFSKRLCHTHGIRLIHRRHVIERHERTVQSLNMKVLGNCIDPINNPGCFYSRKVLATNRKTLAGPVINEQIKQAGLTRTWLSTQNKGRKILQRSIKGFKHH